MKFIKKLTACALSAVLCAGTVGCSGSDKSWAMKRDSETVPIGCYIYNLYASYQTADSEKKDSSKAVLSQKIDSKDAKTWIRDSAYSSTKQILLINQKMKDMKLSLTADEKKAADTLNSTAWAQYSSKFEKYGIAQSSFNAAYGNHIYNERKIFSAIYGKGGSKAVSDADLKNYYVKNYTDCSFLVCPLYKSDSSGNFVSAYTDAQKKAAEKPLNDYAEQIAAGKMTMTQAAAAYKTALKSSAEQLHTDSINLSTDTNYPQTFRDTLKALKAGECKAFEIKDAQSYILLYKEDAAKTAASILASSQRDNLLFSYKGDEFNTTLKKEAEAMAGVTVNDRALNSYDPSMFAS